MAIPEEGFNVAPNIISLCKSCPSFFSPPEGKVLSTFGFSVFSSVFSRFASLAPSSLSPGVAAPPPLNADPIEFMAICVPFFGGLPSRFAAPLLPMDLGLRLPAGLFWLGDS